MPHFPKMAAWGLLLPALASATGSGPGPDPRIEYEARVTLDIAPNACATAQDIVLSVEEDVLVQFCFRARNVGDVEFAFHDVEISGAGRIFSHAPITLPPGEVAVLSRLETIALDRVAVSRWVAKDVLPAYTHAPGIYDFVDIAATGTPLTMPGFFGAVPVLLPFEFKFYGERSDRISVCNNGALEHGRWRLGCGYSTIPLPNRHHPMSMLAFSDLFHPTAGGVYHQTLGSAPSRRWVAQWHRFIHNHPNVSDGATFQVVLHEADGRVDFQYADVTFGGSASEHNAGRFATVGMNYDTWRGDQYSHSTPSLFAGQAIRWTPNHVTSASATGAAAVIVQAAAIEVDVPRVDVIVAPGAIATRQVVIDSIGPASLRWRFGGAEIDGRGHIPRQRRVVAPPSGAGRSTTTAAPIVPETGIEPAAMGRIAAPNRALAGGGAGLPRAYGRETATGQFVAVDLATGELTPISQAQTTPIASVEFLAGDYSRLYAMSGGVGFQSLVTVDPADGATTGVGPSNPIPGYAFVELAYDSSNGVLYATAVPVAGGEYCGGDSRLYRLHRASGTPVPIGVIAPDSCVLGLAVNANGELFGVDVANDTLLAIDKASGAGSIIGPLGFNAHYDQGLEFDEAANVLYLATWNADRGVGELRTVDTSTGTATWQLDFFGTDGPFIQLLSLALESGGHPCVDPASVPWLALSAQQGVLASGESYPVSLTLDATDLAPGRHEAVLCIHSNAPARRFVTLPVSLEVGDSIYANGFEIAEKHVAR